jgi:glutamyl-Q tRNA(Asp) synthetase
MPAARRKARPVQFIPAPASGFRRASARRIAAGADYALRLDVTAAWARTGALDWSEDGKRIAAEPALLGDVVLARKDVPTSYHLAVTVDDALQGVTLVTRGVDLFAATHIHRLLQALLGLPTPAYRHHPLLTDAGGRRLAKRDRALTIRAMRESGMNPAEILRKAQSSAR